MSESTAHLRLEQLVFDLQPVLAHAHVPEGTASSAVTSAEIIGADLAGVGAGAIVLDTMRTVDDVDAEAVRALVDAGAMAVVVRPGRTAPSRWREALQASILPVLVVSSEVSWFQVAALVRERLTASVLGMADRDDVPFGGQDLTQVAEAVSALIRAPVIIQDPDFEILAYSQHQHDADEARAAIVLAHSLPDHYRKVLDEVGAIERVYGSMEPVYLEFAADINPRLAVAVRSGQDIMGSMWAVVPGPVDDQQRTAFADAARVAALSLLHDRARTKARSTLRVGLLTALLTDSQQAADAKARLGLAAQPVAVIAVHCAHPDGSLTTSNDVHRLVGALDLHLRAAAVRAGATLIDGQVFGVVPGTDSAETRRSMDRFAARMKHLDLTIGIGTPRTSASGVQHSRREAETVVSALLAVPDRGPVARFEDAMLGVTLVGLRDYLRRQEIDLPFGPLAVARAYDERTGSDLVATLAAFVGSLGDVARTAGVLNVHANTVRYRLGRLKEAAGLDYLDADQMFLADLQLRLLKLERR